MKASPYRPAMPADWWLSRPSYVRYMLRELTCVFVGAYAGLWVIGLNALAGGRAPWEEFIAVIESVPGLVFQVIALVSVLYHMVTWFALAPRSMALRMRGRAVPAVAVIAGHYLVWAVITVAVLWLGVM